VSVSNDLAEQGAPRDHGAPPGTAVRSYAVLAILTIAYAFAYIDRSIIGVLIPSIKQEFHLSDTSLGLLSGLAFGLFFIVLGVPIAIWADRGNRRNIIALSIALWSIMTAIGGAAGSFVQLVLARIGVGIGEAGLTPPAHALIADLFPKPRRAFALSIYSSGIYVGVLVGLALGGYLAQVLGWREALIVVGTPGLVVAALLILIVREPLRGQSDDAADAIEPHESTARVLRFLWTTKTTRYTFVGISLCSLVTQTQMAWLPSFLVRSHGMSLVHVGALLGLASGIGGFAGTVLGGWLSDTFGARDARWRLWVVAIALSIAPIFILVFLLVSDIRLVAGAAILSATITAIHLAPTAATIQNLVPPRMRARASAAVIFVLNLLGLGVGPLLVGWLSQRLQPLLGQESLRYALTPVVVFALLSAASYFVAGVNYGRHASPSSRLGD
jgi:MFS family permease